MVIENTIINLLIFTLIIIISSLPLYFSVQFLGGKTSILKTFLVTILIAIVSVVVKIALPIYGTFITWIFLIWIFHELFRLKIIKAIIAWILWILFVLIFNFFFSLIGFTGLLLL
jgi:hypothetical protein